MLHGRMSHFLVLPFHHLYQCSLTDEPVLKCSVWRLARDHGWIAQVHDTHYLSMRGVSLLCAHCLPLISCLSSRQGELATASCAGRGHATAPAPYLRLTVRPGDEGGRDCLSNLTYVKKKLQHIWMNWISLATVNCRHLKKEVLSNKEREKIKAVVKRPPPIRKALVFSSGWGDSVDTHTAHPA